MQLKEFMSNHVKTLDSLHCFCCTLGSGQSKEHCFTCHEFDHAFLEILYELGDIHREIHQLAYGMITCADCFKVLVMDIDETGKLVNWESFAECSL